VIPPCVRQIRLRQRSGAYRIIYLTTIGDVVHVLHAFQKKTLATAKRDIDLAKAGRTPGSSQTRDVPEATRRPFGVFHPVLEVLTPHIGLQVSGIVGPGQTRKA
jgi:hypothetical protein